MAVMSAVEIEEFLDDYFPQRLGTIEKVDAAAVAMSLAIEDEHLGPGSSVSAATMTSLAEACAFVAVLAEIGPEEHAASSSMNAHFLKRARADRDLIANARLLKLGSRLAVSEVQVFSTGDDDPVASITVTYVLPDRDD